MYTHFVDIVIFTIFLNFAYSYFYFPKSFLIAHYTYITSSFIRSHLITFQYLWRVRYLLLVLGASVLQLKDLLAAAKSYQSCPTLCNPMDCSLPGSSIHGILQARVLECVAMTYLLKDYKVHNVCVSHSVVSDSFWLFCPWISPGKNTGVGCHSLLYEIFPTQGLNPSLLNCRQILYHLSHQGSP